MEANFNQFLKQTSPNQEIFEYNSYTNDYKFLVGDLTGLSVEELVTENKDELKEYLKEMYYHNDTNTNTKLIISEIIKKHYK